MRKAQSAPTPEPSLREQIDALPFVSVRGVMHVSKPALYELLGIAAQAEPAPEAEQSPAIEQASEAPNELPA